ncbi:MAG: D-alanine aminotransferase [Syntrophomonadaceae bacterium]|nr:D-alanine aminotransferase [Bacillota bacterium]
MPDIYYVNGRFTEPEGAVISVEDRGFLFGDGVYEVLRAYGQHIFRIDEHFKRLSQGLEAINIFYEPVSELKSLILEALRRSGYDAALIYLQITRGIAKRAHVPQKGMQPTVVIMVCEAPALPAELFRNGAKAILYPDLRWAKCHIKTIQLLPNTIALTQAHAESAVEAIMHKNGIVTECGSSNVFIVKNKKVKTHPADEAILHGVSRKTVLEILRNQEVPVLEEEFTVEELLECDEVFITSTRVEVMPITKIDDKPVGNGNPGQITAMLMEEFRRLTVG